MPGLVPALNSAATASDSIRKKKTLLCERNAGKIDDNNIDVKSILFKDEPHFHLDGFVSKHS